MGKTISLKQQGIITEIAVIIKIKIKFIQEKFVEYANMYSSDAKTEMKT